MAVREEAQIVTKPNTLIWMSGDSLKLSGDIFLTVDARFTYCLNSSELFYHQLAYFYLVASSETPTH